VSVRVKEAGMPLVVEMNILILNTNRYVALKFKFEVQFNYHQLSKNKQTKYITNNKTIILLIRITEIAIITFTLIISLNLKVDQ